MDFLKKLIIMIVVLAVIVGLFVLMFVFDDILRALGALFLAGIFVGIVVSLLGLFITLIEAGMGDDENAKLVGTLIKVVLFIVGMIILTPWFYNNVHFF